MPLTLLVDLDDTLLSNEMTTFLPAYLQALTGHLAAYAPARQLVPALLTATQQTVQNQRPDRTLLESFEAFFYPALGLQATEVRGKIDEFYARVFPSLRDLTQPRPSAVALVEHALDCGYWVVIATNPLLPLTAIEQRLEWAGLSPRKYPLKLVPSIESFHFAKPNPAYYAELLARLGWPEGPAVMVGDELENDIYPAQRFGLPAYWITNGDKPRPEGRYAPSRSGPLEGVIPWIESATPDALLPDYSGPEAMLATLSATPAMLRHQTARLALSDFTWYPQPGEWCLTEILCHLRDVEAEVNLSRLRKVLQEDNPFLPGMDTDPWAEERQYKLQDGASALERFIQARLAVLSLLDGLEPEAWNRPARHAFFGPTRLQELVEIIAGHDRLHVRQVHQVLQKRH